MSKFNYSSLFQYKKDNTKYEFISKNGIKERKINNQTFLFIEPKVICDLSERVSLITIGVLAPPAEATRVAD